MAAAAAAPDIAGMDIGSVKRQSHTVGVRNPDARQAQFTNLVGMDRSRPAWGPEFAKQGFEQFPDFVDNADKEPAPWEPVFYRVDKKYHRKFRGDSGAAPAQNAPLTIANRVFVCFNDLPLTRIDHTTGERFIRKKDPLTHKFEWVKWEGPLLDEWDYEYTGHTLDRHTLKMDANNGFAKYSDGGISTWNNGVDDLKANDLIRFGCPEENKQFYIDDDGKTMVPLWALREGDEFNQDRRDMRFAAGVFKVEKKMARTIGYHARVENGGGPGQTIYIRLCPEGQLVQ